MRSLKSRRSLDGEKAKSISSLYNHVHSSWELFYQMREEFEFNTPDGGGYPKYIPPMGE